MKELLATGGTLRQERELVNILIDSALYLDMELVERNRLLHFLMACYLPPAAEEE